MVTARDITQAKRAARNSHIDDNGNAQYDHIFAVVPQQFDITDWHRCADGESEHDKEHLWRHDGKRAMVSMERTMMGWRVEGYGALGTVDEQFDFDKRKHAEAFLIEQMLAYER